MECSRKFSVNRDRGYREPHLFDDFHPHPRPWERLADRRIRVKSNVPSRAEIPRSSPPESCEQRNLELNHFVVRLENGNSIKHGRRLQGVSIAYRCSEDDVLWISFMGDLMVCLLFLSTGWGTSRLPRKTSKPP